MRLVEGRLPISVRRPDHLRLAQQPVELAGSGELMPVAMRLLAAEVKPNSLLKRSMSSASAAVADEVRVG
jgi:hypothetical protein